MLRKHIQVVHGCIHKNFVLSFAYACCRGTFDRQDSLRSDYMSDRESRYGIVQQASIESTDSRLCYLTSSEVSGYWLSYLFSLVLEHFYTKFVLKKCNKLSL